MLPRCASRNSPRLRGARLTPMRYANCLTSIRTFLPPSPHRAAGPSGFPTRPDETCGHVSGCGETWCLGVYFSALWRYQPDGSAFLVAACDNDPGVKTMPVGTRFSLEGDDVRGRIFRTR